MELSPDGSFIVMTGVKSEFQGMPPRYTESTAERESRLFDVSSGSYCDLSQGPFGDFFYSADGRSITVLHAPRTVCEYTLGSQIRIHRYESPIDLVGIVSNAAGDRICGWSDRKVVLWKKSRSKPEVVKRIPTGLVTRNATSTRPAIFASDKFLFLKARNGVIHRLNCQTHNMQSVESKSTGEGMFASTSRGQSILIEHANGVERLDVESMYISKFDLNAMRVLFEPNPRPQIYPPSINGRAINPPKPIIVQRFTSISPATPMLACKNDDGETRIIGDSSVEIAFPSGAILCVVGTDEGFVMLHRDLRSARSPDPEHAGITLINTDSGKQWKVGFDVESGPRLSPYTSRWALDRFAQYAVQCNPKPRNLARPGFEVVSLELASNRRISIDMSGSLLRGPLLTDADQHLLLSVSQTTEPRPRISPSVGICMLLSPALRESPISMGTLAHAVEVAMSPGGDDLAFVEMKIKPGAPISRTSYLAPIDQPEKRKKLHSHRRLSSAFPHGVAWNGKNTLLCSGDGVFAVFDRNGEELKKCVVSKRFQNFRLIGNGNTSAGLGLTRTLPQSWVIVTPHESTEWAVKYDNANQFDIWDSYFDRDDLIMLLSRQQHGISSIQTPRRLVRWQRERGEYKRVRDSILDELALPTEFRVIHPTPDRAVIAILDGDKIQYRLLEDDTVIGSQFLSPDSGACFYTNGGHFDSDLDSAKGGISWRISTDPLNPLPPEIFMRDYFEPRLLARVLAGEELSRVADLSSLNRVQPLVEVRRIEPQPGHDDQVQVVARVHEIKRTYQNDGISETKVSGGRDLRLFRNRQLVGYKDGAWKWQTADPNEVVHADSMAGRFEAALGTPTGRFVDHTFQNIRLPHPISRPVGKAENDSIEFSAYCFNTDRVKSETVRVQHALPAKLSPRKGRAYLLCFGVDSFESPALDLRYAAADGRAIAQVMEKTLNETGQFERVEVIKLISSDEPTEREIRATKQNLEAEFDKLRDKARPEDLVLISFSTHGHNGANGQYYLLPHDIGKGLSRPLSANQLDKLIDKRKAVSTDDLTHWLRDVDAGEFVMIIDACQSAGAIEQNGFKPGPMGSRGLGQLAYSKRMRVLSASQAFEAALEDRAGGSIRHGLLTSALLEPLRSEKPDHRADANQDGRITLGEWLNFPVVRVPELAQDLLSGSRQAFGWSGLRETVVTTQPASDTADSTRYTNVSAAARPLGRIYQNNESIQRPSVFDFSRKNSTSDVVIHGLRE